MKFASLVLVAITAFPLLTAQPVLADPADINCTVLDSGGITLDISVEPSTGQLDGISVFKTLPPVAGKPATSPDITNFPIEQVANFWVDLSSLKVHGVDTDTQLQSIWINYDRGLRVGRISMNLPGYVLIDQILTCSFD